MQKLRKHNQLDVISEGSGVGSAHPWEGSLSYELIFFAMLALLFAVRKVLKHDEKATVVTGKFKKFQRTYLAVYVLAMAADWLQGPYLFHLYHSYGFTVGQISNLFIVGYGTSMVFGVGCGILADNYGRRKICMLYVAAYCLSCLTKHSASYGVLLFGRFLGGIATSVLHSSFESWMIHEHHKAAYPESWLGMTFSLATSCNAVTGLVAGVASNFATGILGLVGSFDLAVACLLLAAFVMSKRWNENVGEAQLDLKNTFYAALRSIEEDPRVLCLGVVQAFFEGAMYVFVFLWTPALQEGSQNLSHGWVFASFMVCYGIGSYLFQVALLNFNLEAVLRTLLVVAFSCLTIPGVLKQQPVRLVCFFAFEVCCGIYWPLTGMLRSRYIGASTRTTVMNLYRVPLNIIVISVLMAVPWFPQHTIFFMCSALGLPAILASHKLSQDVVPEDTSDVEAVHVLVDPGETQEFATAGA